MVNVFRIPQLLEDGIGETQHHDVLRGLLAEVMVDAEGVLFMERFHDHGVQALRAGQVGAERFLHDHAGPAARLRLVESALAQVFQNDGKLIRPGCEIEKPVAPGAALGVEFVEAFGQGFIAFQFVELATVVKN